MARTGLLTELAQKLGTSISDVKRAIMKAAMDAYRKFKEELGVSKIHVPYFYDVLKAVIPAAWEIVRTQHRIPTPDEVLALAKQKYGAYLDKVRAAVAGAAAKA